MTRSLLLLALFFAACTTADSTDSDVEDSIDDGKADGLVRPAGVYSRREATDGQLQELMLFPDKTFIRYESGNDWRERGTYTFTKSTTSSRRYIRFLDSDGEIVDRYTYTMSGSVVRLQRDGAVYPMFSVATGASAWTEAIKTDWFDEAFLDWGAEAFPRTGIKRADLPAGLRNVYDQVADTLGPNTFPLIYSFDLHGKKGWEIDGGSAAVRLYDAIGYEVATGDGESIDDFSWN